MVAERWGDSRDRDTRKGGVAARFRVLGDAGDAPQPMPGGPEQPAGSGPPEFGTAPWGYKRSEVDAWASWVAGLVAHGRNETVRADSAEATLRATLHRLEQLESLEPDATAPRPDSRDPGDASARSPRPVPVPVAAPTELPRRDPRPDDGAALDGATPDGATPAGGADRPETPDDSARTTPPGGPDPAGSPAPARTDAGGDRETARLHVVETTLRDVMSLLHRLVGPDGDGSR